MSCYFCLLFDVVLVIAVSPQVPQQQQEDENVERPASTDPTVEEVTVKDEDEEERMDVRDNSHGPMPHLYRLPQLPPSLLKAIEELGCCLDPGNRRKLVDVIRDDMLKFTSFA